MALICYHASHEQFAPSHLLKLAVAAEQAGFDGLHSSDHFHPWGMAQGHSGFSFSWVAAAMQATALPMSMVCAPGQRYHPAIVAQAISTLAELFPERFCIELGSGEALNECITGEKWPEKKIRQARLLEATHVIRRLLRGEEVCFKGYVTVKNARLWTLPANPVQLLGAAVSETSAAWVGTWADGLLTTADKDLSEAAKKLQAFRANGGEHKPVHVQYSFSYARSRQIAIDEAWQQWKGQISTEQWAEVATPEEFDRLSRTTSKEKVLESTPIFTDMKQLRDELAKLQEMAPTRIILHNLNKHHEDFIEDFGKSR